MGRRGALGGLVALAVLFTAFGLREAWDDAPTYDEPVSLVAGLTALTRHDLRLNIEHPPLAKALAALPALLAGPRIPDGDAWADADDVEATEELLVQNAAAGTLRRTVFLSRLVPLLMAMATAFVLYALGNRLFGRPAGALAGVAWLTLPVVLGIGHVDGLDIPFTLFTALAALATDRLLEAPGPGRAVLTGLAVGATLLTRTSGVVVLGAVVLAIAVAGRRHPRPTLTSVGLVVLVAWLTLWGGYRLLAPGGSDLQTAAPASAVPLPEEYRAGLAQQELFGATGTRSFVLGDYTATSTWTYWPRALLVKLPATTLALLAAGAWALWRRRHLPRARIGAVALVGVALSVATVAGARPIGVRYLLPAVALGLVLASVVAGVVDRHRLGRLVVGTGVALQVVVLVSASDHSLAWVALPTDAPWRLATDSNLDWGQDLHRLQAWSDGRSPLVAWSGPVPEEMIPDARPLATVDPDEVRGWVAANASALTVHFHEELSWLRAYCPVDDLGGTVLLYRFDDPPTSAPGPDTPEGPCAGSTSIRTG